MPDVSFPIENGGSSKNRRNRIMKRIIVLLLLVYGTFCFSHGLENDFRKLTNLSGEKYVKLRDIILRTPGLNGFLEKKLRQKNLSTQHEAEAKILREWLDNKSNIRHVLAEQVVDHTPKKLAVSQRPKGKRTKFTLPPPTCNVPCGGFRYPRWFLLPKKSLDKLMKAYNINPCPWFILECLWKFSEDDLKLITKTFQGIPKYTYRNPEYIFFGMAKEMPKGQRKLFASVLESKIDQVIEKKQTAEKLLPSIEQLLYLGEGQSADIVMKWISCSVDRQSQKFYLIQFIPMVAYLNHIEELKKYAELYNNIPDSKGLKEYYLSFLASLESGNGPDDLWIKRYLALQGRGYPFAFFDTFIYRIRPDLKGKIVEVGEGGNKHAVLKFQEGHS